MDYETPQLSERPGISLVWIVPVITVLVGGWLIYKTLSEQGPEATISFLTAEGIEPGTTRIKYKNVNIGRVEAMQFSDDFSHVVLTLSFIRGTESFLRRNTRFWVVRPQFGLRGISGLETLVSGAYIEIEPGQGAPQTHFVGLEKPPVIRTETLGKRIVLIADRLGSLDTGSPVYYKGILAGEVLGYDLANDHQNVYIHAFIRDPYDQLVRGNTRFWNISGVDVDLGADGLRVRTQSLQSLVFGGVAFETPEGLGQPGGDVADLVYTLYDDYESIQEYSYTRKINFVAYFDRSVRGLSVGAPVEFQGIRVGSVLDFRLEYDGESDSFRIPVLFEIEPERIILARTGESLESEETLHRLIEQGLRAGLVTGNLLTGQLYVDLVMAPDSPMRLVAGGGSLPEMPTISGGGIDSITRSLEAFVARLEQVDIEAIGRELLGTLEGTNRLFNSSAIQDSIDNLQASMQSFRSILATLDESKLGATVTAGRDVLEKLGVTMQLANDALQPGSPLQYNVIQMTSELEEAARSIRSLVETLERNPQSLIFGRGEGE